MMVTQLKLTSFKMIPTGETTVKLKATGETFSLTKPKSRLYNYIVGKMYVWYEGAMECVNRDTKDKLEVIFKKKGWTSKGDYLVEGSLTDSKGNEIYKVDGNWKEFINLVDPKTKEVTQICSRKPEPPNSNAQYNFTRFAIQSNYLTDNMINKMPPTDSRFRPDMRAYEYGDMKLAAEHKKRLEESQRTRRKNMQDSQEWKPIWFEFTKNGDEVFTRFKGEYWKCRESGKWPESIIDLYN